MAESNDIYGLIDRCVEQRDDLDLISCADLCYRSSTGQTRYPFLKLISTEINADDKLLLIRAGIHGDEIAGPLTIAQHLGEICDTAQRSGVKLIIFPLDNPSGFDSRRRYSLEDAGHAGNNDFLRYELPSGEWSWDLAAHQPFKRFLWSSDPQLSIALPQETRALHAELRKLPLSQVLGVIDLHQDNFMNVVGAYHYAFGDLSRYERIIDQVRSIVPLLSHQIITSGYTCDSVLAPCSDDNGFIVRCDGSLCDLFYRLGCPYSVTVETTGSTPLPEAIAINLVWIFGIIELLQGHNR